MSLGPFYFFTISVCLHFVLYSVLPMKFYIHLVYINYNGNLFFCGERLYVQLMFTLCYAFLGFKPFKITG